MIKMQALVALQKFSYGRPSRVLQVGDRFEATPRDAKILQVLKRAQVDVAVDPKSTPDVQKIVETPQMELVEQAMIGDVPVQGAPRRGRRYVKTADND